MKSQNLFRALAFVACVAPGAVFAAETAATAPMGAAAETTMTQVVKTKGGTIVEDTVVGKGAEAKEGLMVKVHYKGTLKDGTVFDSSYKRGEPIELKLGSGMVIKGWDEGIVGMKVGGKRTLTIPYSQAYGEAGRPPVIPAKADLIFETELVEVK